MKYLISETQMFRCDTEKEAEDFVQELKRKQGCDLVSSTITKKEQKSKGEIIDSWSRLSVKLVYNDEKEPEVVYFERGNDDVSI